MNRTEAKNLLKENLSDENLIKHCLAVGAIMKRLAEHFDQDKEKWEVAGILHDIDYEQTKDSPEEHSLKGAEMLKEKGFSDEICHAVKAHNHKHDIELKTMMDKALFVSDPLSGLIVAATLVLPSKKLKDLKKESIRNRFKEKRFAQGANREIIRQSEDLLDLELEKFFQLAYEGMLSISDELGL